MRAIQLLCLLSGGHKAETTEDAFGGTTVCARCGKVQHRPWSSKESAEDGMMVGPVGGVDDAGGGAGGL